jgi:hypothetical protein
MRDPRIRQQNAVPKSDVGSLVGLTVSNGVAFTKPQDSTAATFSIVG